MKYKLMQSSGGWSAGADDVSSAGSCRRADVLFGVIALALAACAQPEPLALEHEVYEVEGGVESLVDSRCTQLPEQPGESFGFGFGTAPGGALVSYAVSYAFENDRVVVSAGALGGAGLSERVYDEAFLSSGREDEFVVGLADDFALLLRNRGVSGCEPLVDTPPPISDAAW